LKPLTQEVKKFSLRLLVESVEERTRRAYEWSCQRASSIFSSGGELLSRLPSFCIYEVGGRSDVVFVGQFADARIVRTPTLAQFLLAAYST
jgi:hypothetical protein